MPKLRTATEPAVVALVAYRPKPGKSAALRRLTREHLPILRRLGMVGRGPALAMTAADGTVLEVFTWKSAALMEAAHSHPVVLKMWKRYASCCNYVSVSQVKEASDLFALFSPFPLP